MFFAAHFPRPNNPTNGTWALSQVTALRDLGHEVRVVSPIPAVPTMVTKILRRGSAAHCPAHHSWNGIDVEYVRWPVYPVGPLAGLVAARPDLAVFQGWMLTARRFL